jgi:hypothetical protein
MKKLIIQSILAAIALILPSCSNNIDEPTQGESEKLDSLEMSFIAVYPSNSRVTDNSFDTSDQIGIYVTSNEESLLTGGNEINNATFVYNGGSWTSPKKVYWNEGSHNVYAYYPYQNEISDINNMNFLVSEDQSTQAKYSASDFLWSSVKNVTASADPVKLQFSHILSKVIVKLEKGDDFEGEIPSNCMVYILNTNTTAEIDLSIGSSAKSANGEENAISCLKIDNENYTAIVVPQNITIRRPLVEVVSGNVSYLLEGTISYKQGMQSTIVVTLSKNPEQTKIEIGGSMGSWN